MTIKPLGTDNGSWQHLKFLWRSQCADFGEDFDSYGQATFSVLDPLADLGHPRSGVYGFFSSDSDCDLVCEANRAIIPGYNGHVLRVRHMTFAPKFDFGDEPVDAYGHALVGLFSGMLNLSNSLGDTPHIKFHLRSPSDRTFFHALATPLGTLPIFESVAVRGAWLYVTKQP